MCAASKNIFLYCFMNYFLICTLMQFCLLRLLKPLPMLLLFTYISIPLSSLCYFFCVNVSKRWWASQGRDLWVFTACKASRTCGWCSVNNNLLNQTSGPIRMLTLCCIFLRIRSLPDVVCLILYTACQPQTWVGKAGQKMQNDLHELESWVGSHPTEFSHNKCEVLQTGNNQIYA